jgi:hypothetical protein
MKSMAGGVVVGVLLTAVAWKWLGPADGNAQQPQLPPPANATQPQMMMVSQPDGGEGPQHLAIYDAEQKVLAVYHLDRTTGAIALKSVRQVTWDMMMQEFNSGAPSPREIQRMLGSGSPYANARR